MSILIVDDSPIHCLLMKEYLQDGGYKSVNVLNSPEELFKFLNLDGDKPPDILPKLILIDCHMPNITGIDAIKKINGNDKINKIPIVLMTADEDDSILESAFNVGATDFIRKPVRRIELLCRIKAILKLYDEVNRRIQREAELKQLTEEMEIVNNKLSELATNDALTGIANRRSFDDFLQKQWKTCVRNQHLMALIFIDVDNFKLFNDHYGHQAGDECLKRLGAVLSSVTRAGTDLAARYGGEEFALILGNTSPEGAMKVASRIQKKVLDLKIPHEKSQASPFVTVSQGVACPVPLSYYAPNILITLADRALYKSKADGRNCINFGEVPREITKKIKKAAS